METNGSQLPKKDGQFLKSFKSLWRCESGRPDQHWVSKILGLNLQGNATTLRSVRCKSK